MEFEVIVEVPKGSSNKYEMDPDTRVIRLDRDLSTAVRYPTDYGFIDGTLSEDGDPLDALVTVAEPTFPGCHITCRPIGMLTIWDERTELNQMPAFLLTGIRHFFDVYKDIETDKYTEVGDWDDRQAAEAEVRRCQERHVAHTRAGTAPRL